MKHFQYLFAALLAVFLAASNLGCSNRSTAFVDMDRYFVYEPTTLKETEKHGEKYYVFASKDYDLTFTIFGYKDFLALPLDIKNKTGQDIEPEDYCIALYDGKDLMPIKLITRKEMSLVEKKLTNSPGFSLTSPSLQGAVSAVDSIVNMPANSSLGNNIQSILDNYFEFRPIYAKSIRKGFLAFYHDFKLEYPLTLKITINGEDTYYYFAPRPK